MADVDLIVIDAGIATPGSRAAGPARAIQAGSAEPLTNAFHIHPSPGSPSRGVRSAPA